MLKKLEYNLKKSTALLYKAEIKYNYYSILNMIILSYEILKICHELKLIVTVHVSDDSMIVSNPSLLIKEEANDNFYIKQMAVWCPEIYLDNLSETKFFSREDNVYFTDERLSRNLNANCYSDSNNINNILRLIELLDSFPLSVGNNDVEYESKPDWEKYNIINERKFKEYTAIASLNSSNLIDIFLTFSSENIKDKLEIAFTEYKYDLLNKKLKINNNKQKVNKI